MYASQTEASWARSAKLTEFQRVKEAVRRLEHTSREQLALERESQTVFDYLKGEVSRIKKSIGALSTVVDEELSTLRSECISLRDEVQRVVDLAKAQTDNAVTLMTESRKRDTEWMQLSFAAVKDSVSKLDSDIKETRAHLFELSAAQASSAARRELESGNSPAMTALAGRLAAIEAGCKELAAEHSALKTEHAALVRFATEIKPQIQGLNQGLRSVPALLEPLQAKITSETSGVAEQVAAVKTEVARHRDAMALLVETVENFSRESKSGHETLSTRITELADVAEARASSQELALNGLGADMDALGDVARRMESRLEEQQQALGEITTKASSHEDLERSLEDAVAEIRSQTSQATSQLKALKLSVKETNDALSTQRTQVRRALDELEKRSDALSKASGVFADALKIPNPVHGTSSLGHIGNAMSSRRSSFSMFSQAEA